MQAKLQMTDLKVQYDSLKPEIDAAMQSVIEDSSFIQGKPLGLLEGEIAGYFGVKFAAGVASGTDALVLALVALGIGQGDEVITTPFTFIATAEAVSRVGAKPVFCDIEYSTYNLDPDKIEAKVTPRTRAIIPVHLYGAPCGMDKIMAIAKKHNLKVLEDCAQSFGSEFAGKKTGAIGDCGALSFFPAKTLGCFGDGGMVITNDEQVAAKIKVLRNHGSTAKYHYAMHGFNSRLDTLQAAVLRVKLKHIDRWIEQRIQNAQIYNQLLGKLPGIIVPQVSDKHTFNYYTIRVKHKREQVLAELKEGQIPTAIYYPLCLHLQEVYKELGYAPGSFPIAEAAQEQVFSLPMYPELPKQDIQNICALIKSGLE
jgi:dTDP-4-amino-4,6-dideoxygalactose transaminase